MISGILAVLLVSGIVTAGALFLALLVMLFHLDWGKVEPDACGPLLAQWTTFLTFLAMDALVAHSLLSRTPHVDGAFVSTLAPLLLMTLVVPLLIGWKRSTSK